MRIKRLRLAMLALVTAGCARSDPPAPVSARPAARPYLNMPADEHGAIPTLLSETGAFIDTRALTPNPALLPYDLNVPFWSDGADKRRWIALPQGEPIHFATTGEWGLPARHRVREALRAPGSAPRNAPARS